MASYYEELIGLAYVTIPEKDFLEIMNPEEPMRGPRWQLEYDRMYDRIVDNSKILAAAGLRQEDFSTVHDALARELAELPADTKWKKDFDICDRMDAYIEKHGL